MLGAAGHEHSDDLEVTRIRQQALVDAKSNRPEAHQQHFGESVRARRRKLRGSSEDGGFVRQRLRCNLGAARVSPGK
jgi:hypothetical protein